MPRSVSFHVLGKPEPKGSTKAFVPMSWATAAVAAGHAPRAVTTSDNPRLKDWQTSVRTCAQSSCDGALLSGALSVTLVFHLARPKSKPAHRVPYPTTIPDVDKLSRAVLDGLESVLFANDAQVVELSATKRYAPIDRAPGADVTVRELGGDTLW